MENTVASKREKNMLVINGYTFQRHDHNHINKDGSVNWRCQYGRSKQFKCPMRASTYINNNNELKWVSEGEHTCPSTSATTRIFLNARATAKKAVREDRRCRPREVFDKEMVKAISKISKSGEISEELARQIPSYSGARTGLYSSRRKGYPKVPATTDDISLNRPDFVKVNLIDYSNKTNKKKTLNTANNYIKCEESQKISATAPPTTTEFIELTELDTKAQEDLSNYSDEDSLIHLGIDGHTATTICSDKPQYDINLIEKLKSKYLSNMKIEKKKPLEQFLKDTASAKLNESDDFDIEQEFSAEKKTRIEGDYEDDKIKLLTEENIIFILDSQETFLISICTGSTKSWRHDNFLSLINNRSNISGSNLLNNLLYGKLSLEKLMFIKANLMRILDNNHFTINKESPLSNIYKEKNLINEYVNLVLVPEFLIKLTSDYLNLSDIESELFLQPKL